jgi:hypothetical protein
MLPAQQRFESYNCSSAETNYGLVKDAELVAGKSGAQIGFEAHASFGARVHRLIEDFAVR